MKADRDGRARARRARAARRGDPARARAARWSSRSGSPPRARPGGTALVLAKLGAEVRSAGAIGTDAARRHAARACSSATASTPSLLVRRDDVQTSASVLPIRPDGSRPAFHVVGANAHLRPRRRRLGRDRRRPRTCTSAARSSWAARRRRRSCPARASAGVVDLGRHPRPGRHAAILEWIAPGARAPRLPAAQRRAGARLHRRATTSRPAAARCSSAASAASPRPAAPTARSSSTPTAPSAVPAFAVDVVDTTGCGDAFSRRLPARPLARPRAPRRRRARLRRRGARRAGARHRPRRRSTSPRPTHWTRGQPLSPPVARSRGPRRARSRRRACGRAGRAPRRRPGTGPGSLEQAGAHLRLGAGDRARGEQVARPDRRRRWTVAWASCCGNVQYSPRAFVRLITSPLSSTSSATSSAQSPSARRYSSGGGSCSPATR